jgi:hypothetical protein
MKTHLLTILTLSAATCSSFAFEPKDFFQYLPLTPLFPHDRESRDYLHLHDPYTPWRATAPVPVFSEVALFRERVDAVRKLEREIPIIIPQATIEEKGFPKPGPVVVIEAPVLKLNPYFDPKDDTTVIKSPWFVIPKDNSLNPKQQPTTDAETEETSKTPLPAVRIPILGSPAEDVYIPFQQEKYTPSPIPQSSVIDSQPTK